MTVDTDPAGGYTGDYVVIYNPSSSTGTAASTGSLSGKIITDLSANVMPARSAEPANSDIPYIIDVDYEMNHLVHKEGIPVASSEKVTYPVGSKHDFTLMGYAPGDSMEFTYEFVVLAVGQHCTIWTTTNPDYHPLNAIDETYAQIAADRFDEKYLLMQAAYGDFNDTNGDGKVNLLFYNIDDGWEPGQGYVAGFFTYDDFQYNNLPMIHIDTYPGIAYTNANGVYIDHFDDCFGTLVHEFQHCINYSETGGMATWLNESLSGSAEELCFPGSGLSERIPSWANHKFASESELLNPPVEYEYTSDFALHKGGSLTSWDSSQLDIYARYAEVMFFSQYLLTRYGDASVYKRIINATTSDTVEASLNALTNATGWSLDSLWQGFFTSLVANDAASGYGFVMNDGYDPAQYHGLSSLYSLLSPVVYTSESAADIYGGGFITVKPVNGVFVPPSGASSTLKYVGVKIGEVGLDGIGLTPESSEILLDETRQLVVVRTPIDANNYEMVWTSSDPSVASVSGNRFSAQVTPNAPGTVTITATATDKDSGAVYTASASVVVRNGYHYTKYVPVNTIDKGKEYMIGASYNGSVYVLMNYNPDYPTEGYYCNSNYINYQLTEYCYGIKAVVDGDGAITGLDNTVYPNAVNKHAEWLFYDSNTAGYYIIRSAYNRNYHLRIANYDNYNGLYPQDGQSYAYMWQWDEANCRLSYKFKTNVVKYVTFLPSAGSFTNLFYAPTTPYSIQLYKKTTGIIMNEDVTYYTVTFKDWDGTVLKTQQVAEGMAATAPADPVRTGWTFAGWDASFDCITADTVVNATYTHNKYYLIIYYRFADNQFAAETYSAYYYYGDPYSVTSPEISGYTPSIAVVEGVMGAENTYITVVYTEEAQPSNLLGDVDCNGEVNFSDVSVLYLFLIGQGQLSEQGYINADFDQNDAVNFGDISILYLHLLGQ